MKTALIIASVEHGNTRKLADAIASEYEISIIDAVKTKNCDLSEFDVIGFASGIFFSKYHKSVLEFAQKNLPSEKMVFFIHTGGNPRENNNASIKSITDAKDCRCLGTYFCKGFDTYGPFKVVGGIAKGHPDDEEIKAAVEFYKTHVCSIDK